MFCRQTRTMFVKMSSLDPSAENWYSSISIGRSAPGGMRSAPRTRTSLLPETAATRTRSVAPFSSRSTVV